MLYVELRAYVGNYFPGNIHMPHTFMVLTDSAGVEHGYGFAPAVPNTAEGAGWVFNDTTHHYSKTTGKIQVTVEQYNKLVDYINASIANPPPYDLVFGSQCADWALSGINQAGINLFAPPGGSPILSPNGILHDFADTLLVNPFVQIAQIMSGSYTRLDEQSIKDASLALETGLSALTSIVANGQYEGIVIPSTRVRGTWDFFDQNSNKEIFIKGVLGAEYHQVVVGSNNPSLAGVVVVSGGSGDDYLYAGKYGSTINGFGGNDYLEGKGGGDTLDGGSGRDVLLGMSGADSLIGGDGNDYLNGGNGDDSLVGDNGNDILVGGQGKLTKADGGEGDDIIISDRTLPYQDNIKGGNGNDLLESYGGADSLDGGDGNDLLLGGDGNDTLIGGKDNDLLQGGDGEDTLQGDEGSDLLQGDSGQDTYRFTSNTFGADLIDDRDGTLQMSGGSVSVGDYDDHKNIWNNNGGGPGEIRRLVSEDGSRTTVVIGNGEDPNNVLFLANFQSGDFGLGFTDPPERTIDLQSGISSGNGGNNVITGYNYVQGSGGNDFIAGTATTDKLYGGDGNDFLTSYSGEDFLDGGAGKDILWGGRDRDILYGGDDDDVILSSVDWRPTSGDILYAAHLASQGDGLSGDYSGLDFYADAKYDQTTDSFTYYAQYSSGISVNLYPDIEMGVMVNGEKTGLNNTLLVLDTQGGGNTGGDLVHGGKGKDFVVGGGDADMLYGEDDDDHLYGRGGSDQLFGGKGKDALYGGDGIDLLDGGKDNDFLFGGYGADVLYGGSGADVMLGDLPDLYGTDAPPLSANPLLYGSDLLYGGQGNDTLYGGGKDDYLYGEADDDQLVGEDGNDWLFGGDNADLMFGDETDINSNVVGNDHMDGGAGVDHIYGGGGNDALKGGDDGDFLFGNAGNDFLQGDTGDDRLYGGGDDDILEGGIGNDTLEGGAGDDVYIVNVGDGNDTLIEDVGTLATMNSRNIVFFKFDATQVTSVQRSGSDLLIRYGGGGDQVTVKNYYGIYNSSNQFEVDPAFEHIEISAFNFEDGTVWETSDIMNMAPPPEVLEPAPEPLAGVAYFIDALVGRDTVKVAGETEISYGFATDAGDTQSFSLFTPEQASAIETALSRFESVLNVHFVTNTGSAPDLTFYLDDLTSGDAGAAAGYGSAGTGEVHLNSVLFKTMSSLNPGHSGFEVLLHEIGHALGLKHPFEDPSLPAAETTQNNTVMAYADNGVNDTDLKLFDIAALQYLYGVNTTINPNDDVHGFGERYIQDGGGHDVFDASGQTVNLTIDLNEGGWSSIGPRADSILADGQSFIGYGSRIEDADAGSGNDTLLGNALDNQLSGGSGLDTLSGGGGNDTLMGGLDADTYDFRPGDGLDDVLETGNDSTIRFNGVTLDNLFEHNGVVYYTAEGDGIRLDPGAVAGWVVNGQQYSTPAFQALSQGFAVSEDSLSLTETDTRGLLLGNADADITGNDLDNHLRGNRGNNLLDGGLGADTLIGGLGDDTYIVDNAADIVIETTGQGHDLMLSFINSTLSDHVEDLTLLSGAETATGNSLDNRLTGNELDNRLEGLAGNDTLEGGEGNDILDGGEGNDVLRGGLGNDRYEIDSLNDVVTEFSDEGTDEIVSSLDSYYLRARNVENLTLKAGSQAITGIGSGDDNVIQGNDHDNRLFGQEGSDTLLGGEGNDLLDGGDEADHLEGGAGDDTLTGGAGADYLEGGAGADTYLYGYGDGIDTIAGADLQNDELQVQAPQEMLLFKQSGEDLWIDFTTNSGMDRIHVVDYFKVDGPDNTRLGAIVTGDGFRYSWQDVKDLATIVASQDDDVITLTSPDKSVYALGGNDLVIGSTGDDVVFGESGDDSLYGGDGADYLDGGEGSNILRGNAGDDILVEKLGSADMDGGEGADTYRVDLGGTYTIHDSDLSGRIEIAPYNWRQGRFSIDQFFQHDDNVGFSTDDMEHLGKDVKVTYDIGTRSVAIDSIDGTTRLVFSDINASMPPYFSLMYTLDFGGRFIDAYDHHVVRDQVYQLNELLGRSSIHIQGTEGDDSIESLSDAGFQDLPANDIRAGGGNDTIYGGNGKDLVFGEAGNDQVFAGDGDDAVDGGTGDDELHGGFGNDALTGGEGNDILVGDQGNDSLFGGAGADTLAGGDGDDTYFVDDAGDQVVEPADRWVNYYGWWGYWERYGNDTVVSTLDYQLGNYIENLTLTGTADLQGSGNSLSNRILGNAGNNVLSGFGGDDELYGNGGNDVLSGGSGTDYLYGGEGDDVLEGGDSWDVLRGDNGNDTLSGGADGDYLDGGTGDDVMLGGQGDDQYDVDSSGDRVIEQSDDYSIDSVRSSVSFALPDFVENLQLTDDYLNSGQAADLVGVGNVLDNTIVGNAGKNQLSGDMGNDYLDGAGGDDTLTGGDGDDILKGGAEALQVRVDNEAGTAELISVTTNNDWLDGGAGDDDLDGQAGDDTLIGGAGNDHLFGGQDSGPYTYYFGGEVPYTFDNAPTLSNNDFLDGGEGDDALEGGSGNDTLIGGLGSDNLDGGDGNDLLDARDGDISDVLSGGAGDDTFYIDGVTDTSQPAPANLFLDAGGSCDLGTGEVSVTLVSKAFVTMNDAVFENPDEGYDVIYSDASIILPENVEEVRLTGSDNLDVVGSWNDNLLIGNDGDNILDGGDGNDTLSGGLGDDVYFIDSPEDQVIEAQGAGRDTVVTTSNGYRLGNNIENLYLGAGVIAADGNDGDNLILGNSLDNVIHGWGGNDRIRAAGGDDIILGGAGNDTFIYYAGDGHDLILDQGGTDNLHFSEDFSPDDLRFTLDGDDLVVSFTDREGGVRLVNWVNADNRIEQVGFCESDVIIDLNTVVTTPGNHPPVVLDDRRDLSEDRVIEVSGNVLTNDNDPEGLPLVVANPGTYQLGHGLLVIAAEGTYRYTMANDQQAVQSLGEGEILSDQFEVRVADSGSPAQTSRSQLAFTITGTNDIPLAQADFIPLNEDGGPVEGNVLENDRDPDANDVLTTTPLALQGSYGHLELATDGHYRYLLDDLKTQSLAAGQVVEDTFSYTVTDGRASVETSLILSISGSNDAPVTAADSLIVHEDDTQPGTVNVLSNDRDPDMGSALQTTAVVSHGQFGDLTVLSDGTAIYQVNNSLASVQSLGVGQSAQESFEYQADDGVATTSGHLVVTVQGVNDAPELSPLNGTLTQNDTGIAVDVLSQAHDVDAGDLLSVTPVADTATDYGHWSLGADGVVHYQLNAATVQSLGDGQSVTETLNYGVSDGHVSTTGQLSLTITGLNDAPETTADSARLTEDTATVSGNVLSNDRDPDATDYLSVANAGQWQGQYGMLTLGADGAYVYALDTGLAQSLAAGALAQEVFTYTATDGRVATNAALTITITGANDVPVLTADTGRMTVGDAPLAGNVLSNDADPDAGTVLQAVAGQLAGQYGTLDLAEDGRYAYRLNSDMSDLVALGEGQTVVEHFRFTATDGLVPVQSTLDISVVGRNDAPVVGSDTETLTEDTVTVSGNVLSNDRDPDAPDHLSVANAGQQQGQYGVLTLGADGAWSYALNTALTQSLQAGESRIEAFAYQATDGTVSTASNLTLTITGANDAPVVVADTLLVHEDDTQPNSVNVLSNDRDPDAGATLQAVASVLHGQYGDLTVLADGTASYQVNNSLASVQSLGVGQSAQESFQYLAGDGVATTPGNLVVTVQGVNDAPVLAPLNGALTQNDTGIAVDVLAQARDVDANDVLSVTPVTDTATAHGRWSVGTDGVVHYLLDATSVQSLGDGQSVTETLNYGVSDGHITTTGQLSLTITGLNDAPVTTWDVGSLTEDTATVSGNVLSNDRDPDAADHLSVANAGQWQGQYGVLTLGADGAWSYALNTALVQSLKAGESQVEAFAYQATDGTVSTASSLTLTIAGANDAPVTTVDSLTVHEDDLQAGSVNVLSNDTDPDTGTMLQATPSALHGQYGDLMVLADGTASYRVNNSLASVQSLGVGQSLQESFQYLAGDGVMTTPGNLVVIVQGVNDAPVVTTDSANLTEDTATVSGNVLSNDRDQDATDHLSVANAGQWQGQYGVLTLGADGSYAYALNTAQVQSLAAGASAQDVFTYAATDGRVSTNAALTITITGTNDAPVLTADTGRISVGDAPLAGNVLGNDTDADAGTVLRAVAGQQVGQFGTLNLSADGSYAYSLNSSLPALVALGDGQTVVEHFRYTATDGLAPVQSDLNITVVGRNDQPVASPDSLTVHEDDTTTALLNVLTNDHDPDQGDTLSAVAATLHGQYGDLVIQANGQTEYRVNNALSAVQQLAEGQQVQDVFGYQAVDNHGATATAGMTVNVIGRNDAPVATGSVANQTVASGNAISLTLNSAALFTDVDQGDRLTLSLLQSNGQALPSWLSFNAQTGVLSGTSTGAAATYSLSLSATDLSGAKAALTFNLNVTAPVQPGVINGTDGNDVLTGTSGNDVIDGRGGSDTMSGGAGDDIYYVDTVPSSCGSSTHGNEGVGNGEDPPPPGHDTNLNDGPGTGPGNPGQSQGGGGTGTSSGPTTSVPGDLVVEASGQGYDLVRSTVSYTLPDNVEALELLGTQAINATGNSLANRLTGNSAANRLDGGAGADRLIGLGGDDTYVVDNASDVIVEELNGGTDSVEAGLSWTLGANLENLLLTGNGAMDGTGNTLANRLQGSSGNNTLTGLAGNDTYVFGQGWGKDTVVDQDATVGNHDVIAFGSDISIDELWFAKKGNNLVISQIGTNDSVTVQDWYKGDAYQVEEVRTADGHSLDHTKVAQLVQAMSGISAPTGSQTCLSTAQHQRLDPVIAVTWANG